MKHKKSQIRLRQRTSSFILVICREQVKQEMEEEPNDENSNDSATLQSSENVDGKNCFSKLNIGNLIEQEKDEQEEEQVPSKLEETEELKASEVEQPETTKKKRGLGFRDSVKCIEF